MRQGVCGTTVDGLQCLSVLPVTDVLRSKANTRRNDEGSRGRRCFENHVTPYDEPLQSAGQGVGMSRGTAERYRSSEDGASKLKEVRDAFENSRSCIVGV